MLHYKLKVGASICMKGLIDFHDGLFSLLWFVLKQIHCAGCSTATGEEVVRPQSKIKAHINNGSHTVAPLFFVNTKICHYDKT